MKLNEVNGQFEALGIGVAGITYDDTELIQQFHDQWGLEFPLLRDVDRQHVEAWEILNEEEDSEIESNGVISRGDGKSVCRWPKGQRDLQIKWKSRDLRVRYSLVPIFREWRESREGDASSGEGS